jgi:putative SOS response-associated peptidase YedK
MCGRYVNGPMTRSYWREQQDLLDEVGPSYNVAPTRHAPILRWGTKGREYTPARWGLIPSWAKDKSIGSRCINARSETVREKPSFRSAFKRRRCLVLADGYYEWLAYQGTKQPYYIRRVEDAPLLFFGLWETWSGPTDAPLKKPLETFTVLTTSANEQLSWLHDRMPCTSDLGEEHIVLWLDPEFEDYAYLESLLKSYPDGTLTAYPVSKYVNKVGNDGPECIERVELPS